MRLHRFYVKQTLGEEIVVDDVSTIKQWSRVFRYRIGDFVILFDGHFKDCTYEIASISMKEATLRLASSKEVSLPSKKLTLYISVIKKDNFELAVQKCTELGVSEIIPILSEHSEKKNLNMERLENIAKEAAEQCGRGDVPMIHRIMTLNDAFRTRNTTISHVVSDIGGESYSTSRGKEALSSKNLALWIGPEGGWGDKDREIFISEKVMTLSFGVNIMRAETACIVLSGIFLLR